MTESNSSDVGHSFRKPNVTITPMVMYIVMMAFSLAALVAVFLLTEGDLFESYFYSDPIDAGMDFFNSVYDMHDGRPYELRHSLYPPLANLLFLVIAKMMPGKVTDGWTSALQESVADRGTPNDMRMFVAPMVCFIMICVLIGSLLVLALKNLLSKGGNARTSAAAVLSLFCFGVMYAYERGNVTLLIAVVCVAHFVANYRAERKLIRESALIALAIAINMKVYPVFFAVLLLRCKDWKGLLRAVVYSAALFILPQFLFEEGPQASIAWFTHMIGWGGLKSSTNPWLTLSILSPLSRLIHQFGLMANVEVQAGFSGAVHYLALAAMLVVAYVQEREWSAVLACFLACIYSAQAIYVLSFMLVPVFVFMRDEPRPKVAALVPFLMMVLLVAPLPVFNILGGTHWLLIIQQMLIGLLVLYLLLISCNLAIIHFRAVFVRKRTH